MELALYCPVYGYYEKQEDTIGRRGDFFTSVSVGSLFGELLAVQFSEWLDLLGSQSLGSKACLSQSAVGSADAARDIGEPRLQLVETGAHDGRLAGDILSWLRQRRAELFERLEYWIIEPSARRREGQKRHLSEFGPAVRWAANLSELLNSAPSPLTTQQLPWVCGVIFSNELLDALPVHRLGWDAALRRWFEWGVMIDTGRFRWTRMPLNESRLAHHSSPITHDAFTALSAVLPDGFTIELCPAAEEWWRSAAAALRCGKLLTIDYGLAAEEKFVPERTQGTVRAFHQHRLSDDLLARPGEQDITAHVDFEAISHGGELAGLTTEQFVTQEKFLTQITERVWPVSAPPGQWTPEQRRQFKTLTHPDHLGCAFRVLVQSRM